MFEYNFLSVSLLLFLSLFFVNFKYHLMYMDYFSPFMVELVEVTM